MRRALLLLTLVLLVGCGSDDDAARGPVLPAPSQPSGRLVLTSPAFPAGTAIPKTYTCDGRDISPPLRWSGAPAGTRELALIVEDPDADRFLHWTLVAIPASTRGLAAGHVPPHSIQTTNGFGKREYGGPCPPKGKTHHYVFTLYALNARSGLAPSASPDDVTRALQAHATARGTLTGIYTRAS